MDENEEIQNANKIIEQNNLKLDETLDRISGNYAKINASLEEMRKQLSAKTDELTNLKAKKFFFKIQSDLLKVQEKLSEANTRIQNSPTNIFEMLYELEKPHIGVINDENNTE